MFKPNKLLKVVSIIMIIFGVFGIIGAIAGFVMMGNPDMMKIVESTGVQVTRLDYVIALISGALEIAAGILGVKGRSAKLCYTVEGCDILIIIVNIVLTIMKTGLVWTFVISFILPVLYLWGVYQSQES